jgi:hypothetical protein
MGRFFASGLSGQTPEAVNCTLRSPQGPGDTAQLAAALSEAYGPLANTADGQTLTIEASGAQAWSVAQWAVANAKGFAVTNVDVAGRSWDRASRDGWQISDATDSQVRITVSPEATNS